MGLHVIKLSPVRGYFDLGLRNFHWGNNLALLRRQIMNLTFLDNSLVVAFKDLLVIGLCFLFLLFKWIIDGPLLGTETVDRLPLADGLGVHIF